MIKPIFTSHRDENYATNFCISFVDSAVYRFILYLATTVDGALRTRTIEALAMYRRELMRADTKTAFKPS